MPSYMQELDRIRDEVVARNPGWRIWYVPRHPNGVTWCCHRLPSLQADSAEGLEAQIAEAENQTAPAPVEPGPLP